MILDRISNISNSENVFKRAAPVYNDALKASGYKETLKFNKNTLKTKQSRSRNIIWFNSSYSINVRTNVNEHFQ